jgi:hypothetical protein
LIYFIVICFKSVTYIREKLGALAALVFLFSLFSFAFPKNKPKNNFDKFDLQNKGKLEFKHEIYDGIESSIVNLEKNLFSEIQLSIQYNKEKNDVKPIEAFTSRTGLVLGIKWNPKAIELHRIEKTKSYTYKVVGIKEWSILGLGVYNEFKRFNGTIYLR